MGQKWQRLLVAEMMPVQTAWLTLCELFPDPAAKLPVQFRYQNISISDWLENLLLMISKPFPSCRSPAKYAIPGRITCR
jgi:hypothetical protein